ncbi:CcoQ/FixQ family Cbb3-type cytochrome c oxidase assembly chaperone [Flavobacterium sediminis]|uniref:CcoQ/FixQ family Cbb3-type cytochrome c oxidase assembly chaperone n=1 Tax=Flavobacterium sediminis TaxID=2201181 RepID=A0A2U8QX99_9FLAO|nr:CcoQ/FixQ family Cbb3-type cytochrome c oxidase assembly chaperone [Flavobacterium sediminis]AWM14842.1 CcoQ/FixQ family Cbb3-type cytochrome c oxidase assembly chaperone [Flavobacterium sediminis]
MLKFVKHNLETIVGVEIYPIISLTIFFVVFVAFFIWAMTYSKEKINELSELPFKEDNN